MSTAPGMPDPRGAGGSPDDTGHPAGSSSHSSTHRPDETRIRPTVPQPWVPPTPQTTDPKTTGAIAASTAAVAVAVPWSFPAGGGPTTLDLAVGSRVYPWFDARPWAAEIFALATDIWVVLALLCGSALWFTRQRRWWETVTVVLVPEAAVAVNTWVLKPWWGRPLHDYLAYPSGHTVHLVAAVTVLVLLLRSVRARRMVVALAIAVLCVGTLGMVALDYHVVTDIVGGAAAGISLAIALYWVSVAVSRLCNAGRPDRISTECGNYR